MLVRLVITASSIAVFYIFYFIAKSTPLDAFCTQLRLSAKTTVDTAAPIPIAKSQGVPCVEQSMVLQHLNNKLSTTDVEEDPGCQWDPVLDPHFVVLDNKQFHQYKGGHLIVPNFERFGSALLSRSEQSKCRLIANPSSSVKPARATCLSVVRVKDISTSFLMLRSDQEVKDRSILHGPTGTTVVPTGIYRQSSHTTGRLRLVQKLAPFFNHLPALEAKLSAKLGARGLVPRKDMDVVVMVLNDGGCCAVLCCAVGWCVYTVCRVDGIM